MCFKECEGEKNPNDDPIKDALHLKPLKLWKHNIRTEENPKLSSIGDYWDEQATKEIFDLLKEYEDLFPTSISKLKWIKADLGKMKIILKPGARLVKHQPYWLNSWIKEKLKKEIDKILVASLIFPIDEA